MVPVRSQAPTLEEIVPGVAFLDTDQFGVAGQGGVYILSGRPAALVEAGTSLAEERILAALDLRRIPRHDVGWIFLTHIHLDHAGGAGGLLRQLPKAKVVVHARGARHLLDPARLVASVKEAVRERFPLYGGVTPVPEDRLHVSQDGELHSLGRFAIRSVDAPGHAPHHLCFFEESQRLLFTGDASGLYLEGTLIPSTVPPSFDLGTSLATLSRLADLRPARLLFTHFGAGDPDLLSQYAEVLRAWVERVRRLRRPHATEDEIVAAILRESEEEGLIPGGPARGDLAMSARGVLAYLDQQEDRT